jgi:hypothetical protein
LNEFKCPALWPGPHVSGTASPVPRCRATHVLWSSTPTAARPPRRAPPQTPTRGAAPIPPSSACPPPHRIAIKKAQAVTVAPFLPSAPYSPQSAAQRLSSPPLLLVQSSPPGAAVGHVGIGRITNTDCPSWWSPTTAAIFSDSKVPHPLPPSPRAQGATHLRH